ncbi:MAG: radical SAM protein [Patescibacteria group bacterium]|nr:radical SAM protein [Patescibacteria group bacterium]
MSKREFNYIYGPVPSWRLGRSLGIDPISYKGKVCTFDCLYCQIGKTSFLTDKRKTFVSAEKIIRELKSLPPLKIDYITFSGAGEPTLAKNLGQMIKMVKRISGEKIAVITNSSLMGRKDVQKDLLLADFVVAKLDASSQNGLKEMNRPIKTVGFGDIIKGIKDFRKYYKGRLALQAMFTEKNKKYAVGIARIASEINPDEIQINTPLRRCRVKPLPKKDLDAIRRLFIRECGNDVKIISVYDSKKKKVKPISNDETLKRRGKV